MKIHVRTRHHSRGQGEGDTLELALQVQEEQSELPANTFTSDFGYDAENLG